HALAAALLHRVLVGRGALGVAAFGSHEHVRGAFAFPDDVHAEQVVALGEAHTDDTAGGAAHGAQRVVGGGESDRLGVAADQQQVVGGVDEPGGDELVVFPQVDGDDAGGAGGVELRQLGLLHQAGAGGEHQVGGGVVRSEERRVGEE